jgi:hypothetical protein
LASEPLLRWRLRQVQDFTPVLDEMDGDGVFAAGETNDLIARRGRNLKAKMLIEPLQTNCAIAPQPDFDLAACPQIL